MISRNLTVLACLGTLTLGACSSGESPLDRAADAGRPSAAPATPSAVITTNVASGAQDVPVDRLVRLDVESGEFSQVTVRTRKGAEVAGRMTPDGSAWVASQRLEPGTRYVVSARATDAAGLPTTERFGFRAQPLSLDQQTFASVAPLDGQTVGVGFPILVSFDIPVKNRALFEKHMRVTSSAGQQGAWHWLDDKRVHYRPQGYWKPGSTIDVDLDLNSLPAAPSVYGQKDRHLRFTVGRSVVAKVDAQAHAMKVFIDGGLARTIPITLGKDGFESRSGTKVIIEKFETKRMDAATTGISPGDPEYYNIADVQYAQRLTFSGEFVHAAPWSAGSQGSDNVSHGCTGMSVADAAWFYSVTQPGDVVEYVGTERQMTIDNGYGDWNLSWADWKAGSALS